MAVSRINEAGLNVNQYGNRNLIINGAMLVDQRNDGSSAAVTHAADHFIGDRFRFTENHTGSFSAQQVSDAPVGFEKSSKVTVTGTDTSLGASEFSRILQGIEGQNITHLNWGSANAKTCTLTFYVKSSVAGQYYLSIFNNAANRTMLKGYTIDAADTWEKKTIQIIGDQTGTWLTSNLTGIYLSWSLGTGSTYQSSTLDAYQAGFYMAKSDQVNLAATSSATWQLTGVQFEVGTEATDFEHRSFGDELARCQRYYYRMKPINPSGGVAHAGAFNIHARTSTQLYGVVHLPTSMRTTPSIAISSTSDMTAYHGSGSLTVSSFTMNGMTTASSAEINVTVSSGGSAGTAGWLRINSATGYIEFNSEL